MSKSEKERSAFANKNKIPANLSLVLTCHLMLFKRGQSSATLQMCRAAVKSQVDRHLLVLQLCRDVHMASFSMEILCWRTSAEFG